MRSGIAGIVYPDPFQVGHLLTPILKTLSHRGYPNLYEEFTYKNIQIGITGGALAHSSKAVVAIDGRLNHAANLSAQLKAQGFQINTDSQAELLLYAYELWGETFLTHISGNFSFAMIDKIDGRLILARDRVGKNPLYWSESHHHFIFSSELKGILASGIVPQTPSNEGIAHYLYFGYTPRDLTPIKDVNKLLPGNSLEYHQDKSKVIQAYWSLSDQIQKKKNKPTELFITEFNTLFKETIAEQVPSSTPFGCIVSGGIGSASIAYYLNQCVEKNSFDAYTVAFQDENMEDLQAAEEVARTLQIKQHCDVITPTDFLKELPKILWYLDEPLADPNIIGTWRLGRLAQGSHVVFSGMGSDELLAGHSRYTTTELEEVPFWDSIKQTIAHYLVPIVSALSKEQGYNLLRQTRSNSSQYNYLSHNAIFSEEELNQAAKRIAAEFDLHVFLHKFYKLPEIHSLVPSLIYLDVKTRLVDNFILQYERLMTANGLEWRTPFISKEMIEFLAGSIEEEHFLEKDTFFIMKQILKGILPDSFLYRPKRTRSDFLKSWVSETRLPELFKLLLKGSLVESGIISASWLQQQLKSVEQEKRSFRQLWSVLILELWFRLYINQPIQASPPQLNAEELLIKN